MGEAQEGAAEEEISPIYWLALGYAAVVGLGWLTYGMTQLFTYRRYAGQVDAALAAGQNEYAERIRVFASDYVVNMGFAFVTAAIFAFAAFALSRRSWNLWDYATIVVGFPGALSLVFLCLRGRPNLFIIGPTLLALLGLLYTKPVKAAMGVGRTALPDVPADQPVSALNRDEIEREIKKERTLIAQLAQNLDVFEVERGMTTDRFVARYAEGLEDDTPDNAEWFTIARAVGRSRERLQSLTAQLEARSQSDQA